MNALLGLDLRGRRVLVAGGGRVAARRVRRFLAEGAEVVVVAPAATEDLATQALHGDVEWRRTAVAPQDLDGAWLAVAATDDPDVNDAVASWAAQRRIWCVNASNAAAGTARQAATSTHGEVRIGVLSTDKPDPARIRGVRDAISAHVDSGGVDLRRRRKGAGRVILVGSGPGDPGLLTVRARQALAEAHVVVSDRLGATEVLATLPYDVEVLNVGKSPEKHPVPQEEINRLLVDRAGAGATVVRLKGGDPFLFGRGGEEIAACVAAGIPVEVVPGVSSAFAVPGLAKIPVTHREVTASVVVSGGHAGPDPAAIAAVAKGATGVFLMAVASLPDICEAALAAGVSPTTPVALIESGSTPRERVTRGTVASIAQLAQEAEVKPPAIVVIGEVARPGFLGAAGPNGEPPT